MTADAVPAAPADEARHEPGDEPLWAESWYLDFVDADNAIAGYVRLSIQPELGRAWYWACVVGPDRPLVTGCVYNSANPPPYALPGEKTKSTIKSSSSLGGTTRPACSIR